MFGRSKQPVGRGDDGERDADVGEEVAARLGRYLGDYITAAAAPDGSLDTMWTDTALGKPKETDL